MRVIYYTQNSSDIAPLKKNGCVAVLGLFDGVHIAHRALIDAGKRLAENAGIPLVIFTFSGEGNAIKPGIGRIYTDKEKLALFSECGIDFTVMADFESMRQMPHTEFAEKVLISELGARYFVCGYDYRYGKSALGTADMLKTVFSSHGLCGMIIDRISENGVAVSSTEIRTLIEKRDMRQAAKMLGKPYFISGKTEHGMGLGRQLGIPTVNIDLDSRRSAPPRGVYLTAAAVGKRIFPALTNVGTCPTFTERNIHTETFILDFNGDLYDESITVYFIEHLRDEKKFANEKELIMQIDVDKNKAISIWEEIKWQEIGLNLQ